MDSVARSFRNQSVLLVGVILAAIFVLTDAPTSRAVAAPGSAPVIVTNTPLPVSAAQDGAWSVSVSGTPNVNIANTPSVTLAAGTSVRDFDNPAKQPVQFYKSIALAAGEDYKIGYIEVGQLIDAAGKMLVIENVSGWGLLPINQKFTNISVYTYQPGGNRVPHFFVPTFTGNYNGTTDNYNISSPTRLYDCCETALWVQANRNAGSGTASFNFAISGHLVDLYP
jgi:hypothetical protein